MRAQHAAEERADVLQEETAISAATGIVVCPLTSI